MTTPDPLLVVPALQRWEPAEGRLVLPPVLTWDLEGTERSAGVERALTDLATAAGRGCARTTTAADVTVRVDPALAVVGSDSDEASRLRVSRNGVEVVARSEVGALWALENLAQLVEDGSVPCGTATDWPNYPVRGFMLDVARRFVPMDTLHEIVRRMGALKLNTFVVHLNDNEITKDTGRAWSEAQHAFRLRSENPAFARFAATDGCYTREEWDALEETAAAHGVTLVPEIDAPAHARAFIALEPSLGLAGGDSDMLDLTRPGTVRFMKDLFAEFLPWFRGPWVHFGADEYDRTITEPYRDYFNTMAAFLREHGKRPIAWGSLASMADGGERAVGYDRDVTICSWNNEWYGPQQAVADGYDVVNTNDVLLYIVPFADYYRGQHLDGPLLWETWEPHVFPDGQSLEPQHPQLRGAISALWNDLVLLDYDERTMLAMIEPTFALLAQKMWSGAVPGVGYEQFMARVGLPATPAPIPHPQ